MGLPPACGGEGTPLGSREPTYVRGKPGRLDLRRRLATVAVRVATPDSIDIAELAAVAARTFPLACPPSATRTDIASFVDANLSAARFGEHLANPQRLILTASQDNRIVGYAMLIRGVGDDPDVRRAVRVRPAVELSKMYVLPNYHGNHGAGVSTALMEAALAGAAEWGAGCVWLGVNQENQRAQQFYKKCGFAVNGTRTFQLGAHGENDYVMVRQLGAA
jgi:ribosomal protein S18 acetylase RimI-like enzyme